MTLRRWGSILSFLLISASVNAGERIRLASYNTELSRDGPGLLLSDILRREAPDIRAVAEVISHAKADILVLQGIDWDYENHTLSALAELLAEAGIEYGHQFALRPNSGLATSFDLDGDGRFGGPGDAQGFGRFTGSSGLALLSVFPIDTASVTDLSSLLWHEIPDARMPQDDLGNPFPSEDAQVAQRLSSTGHWMVPIILSDSTIMTVMMFQAGPPVFDGSEDRNGLRNRDEIRLWSLVMDGLIGAPPTRPFVIAGGANLDPDKGEGFREMIQTLLTDPRLQDPRPISHGIADSAATVEWEATGPMRVDYILPSSEIGVKASGVLWPRVDDPLAQVVVSASRHRLVWVDMEIE
ncbi:MAG: endonuclease/exonuclease/phosphatase family protein [Paracoccaceae bacterium]